MSGSGRWLSRRVKRACEGCWARGSPPPAEHCLGNMEHTRGARAVREAKGIAELDARVATVRAAERQAGGRAETVWGRAGCAPLVPQHLADGARGALLRASIWHRPHAGHVCGGAQVAVHLGMMEDARKLFVAAERYDLLNKLYQVSRVQGLCRGDATSAGRGGRAARPHDGPAAPSCAHHATRGALPCRDE